MDDHSGKSKPQILEELHATAEAKVKSYSYAKPSGVNSAKGVVRLGQCDYVRADVQIVKKDGGENNLHYHSNGEGFWMVLKGRVRFYGPGDVVLGEFGPQEGIITPVYSRYWFENAGDEDLEILHINAQVNAAITNSGRTDLEAQKFKIDTAQMFGAQGG